MEIWDLYDFSKNKTGETIQRGLPLPTDRFHLVVHFWIKNAKNKYLIQKRSNNVELNKGMWAFTGGSAFSGETSEQAVVREVWEEIGYSIDPSELMNIHSYFRKDYWVDVYLLKKDIPIIEFEVGEEVEKVKYVDRSDIEKMRNNGLFWNLDDEYLEKLFFH